MEAQLLHNIFFFVESGRAAGAVEAELDTGPPPTAHSSSLHLPLKNFSFSRLFFPHPLIPSVQEITTPPFVASHVLTFDMYIVIFGAFRIVHQHLKAKQNKKKSAWTVFILFFAIFFYFYFYFLTFLF